MHKEISSKIKEVAETNLKKETNDKESLADSKAKLNETEKKLKGVSFEEAPEIIAEDDQSKVTGRGVLKPLQERDFQVPLNDVERPGASVSGTKYMVKEVWINGERVEQENDTKMKKQSGAQSVCEKATMAKEKETEAVKENVHNAREKVRVTEQTRPEAPGIEINRGYTKGKAVQTNQGNQWSMGRKVTALFSTESSKNGGGAFDTHENGVPGKPGGGENFERGKEGCKEGYESGKEKYETVRGRGMSSRGRGGREGTRGGRGGRGRGFSSEHYDTEKEEIRHENVGERNETHKIQKELFKEKEKQGREGEEKRNEGGDSVKENGARKGRRETCKPEKVNNGNYFGVLPVDVDGDADQEWDPGDDEREEGEVRDSSSSSDEDFTASVEKSEEEEEHERVSEVKKETDRKLMGVNATPTKLTKAQKKKLRKKRGSGGGEAKASGCGGGVER
nr:hypothetical protein Iba_scaffold1536CG1760 [Ipomoea batatas]